MSEPLIARSPTRGEVTQWHRGNMGGPPSRAFNHLEADPKFMKIGEQMEDVVEAVYERYAKKFLDYYRKRLKEHNYANHLIKFSCGMGSCSILVGNRRKINPEYRLLQEIHGKGACLWLLQEIEQSMSWDWGSYLDGVILNEAT